MSDMAVPIYNETSPKRYPFYEILTGNDCNMRCKYCYIHKKGNNVNTVANINTFLEAMDRRDSAQQFQNNPYAPRLGIMGGEPFLHTDLLDAMLTKTHELNVKNGLIEDPYVGITTNGTLITKSKEVRDFLEKWKDYIRLNFSIDGTKRMHDMFRVYPDGSGTYDDAIAGYLCARDIIGNNKCNVKMTPCRANIDELPQGVIELFELGLRYIQCAVVLEDRWEEEEEDYVYSLMLPIMDYLLENKRYKTKTFAPIRPRMAFMQKMNSSPNCSACKGGTACLSFDGKIYGCHHFCTLDVPADYGAVDLENNRIVIYNEPLIYKLLNTWRSRSEKCLNCELGVHCVACSAAMYECNPENLGEFHEKYTQCGWTKGVFKARMEFKDRIAQAETSQDE